MPTEHGVLQLPLAENFTGITDWNLRGPYRSCVTSHRLAGGFHVVRSAQPAGSYPDPPMPSFSVFRVFSGDGVVDTDFGDGRRRKAIETGDVGVTPANTGFDVVQHGNCEFIAFSLPLSRIAELSERATGQAVSDLGQCHSLFQDPLIDQLCVRLWDEAADGNPFGSVFSETLLDALILSLLKYGKSPRSWPSDRKRFSRLQLKQVCSFIEDHLASDIALSDLASLAHMSTFHFARVFKEMTGCTPHQFVIAKRIDRAKQLLRGGRHSIAQVAAAVGFCDQSHLSRHFRRIVGCSPSRFH